MISLLSHDSSDKTDVISIKYKYGFNFCINYYIQWFGYEWYTHVYNNVIHSGEFILKVIDCRVLNHPCWNSSNFAPAGYYTYIHNVTGQSFCSILAAKRHCYSRNTIQGLIPWRLRGSPVRPLAKYNQGERIKILIQLTPYFLCSVLCLESSRMFVKNSPLRIHAKYYLLHVSNEFYSQLKF